MSDNKDQAKAFADRSIAKVQELEKSFPLGNPELCGQGGPGSGGSGGSVNPPILLSINMPTAVFWGIMRRAAAIYGKEVEDYLKTAKEEDAFRLIIAIQGVIDNDREYCMRKKAKQDEHA